jgi:hypothetical protein
MGAKGLGRLGTTAVLLALIVVAGTSRLQLMERIVNNVVHEELVKLRQFVKNPNLNGFKAVLIEFWEIIGPGGKLHPGWFLEHKGHLVIEGLLMVIIAVMLLQSRFYPNRAKEDEDALTEQVGGATCAGTQQLLLWKKHK